MNKNLLRIEMLDAGLSIETVEAVFKDAHPADLELVGQVCAGFATDKRRSFSELLTRPQSMQLASEQALGHSDPSVRAVGAALLRFGGLISRKSANQRHTHTGPVLSHQRHQGVFLCS
jgi:hypothetical protein